MIHEIDDEKIIDKITNIVDIIITSLTMIGLICAIFSVLTI